LNIWKVFRLKAQQFSLNLAFSWTTSLNPGGEMHFFRLFGPRAKGKRIIFCDRAKMMISGRTFKVLELWRALCLPGSLKEGLQKKGLQKKDARNKS
jgi:hypothetical protein